MFKRYLKFALILSAAAVLLCAAIPSNGRVVQADGRAETVIELSTGKILEEKNANLRLPMASTTKIMTALIIVEECNLDEEITVPREAVGVEGSSIYLKYDEKISVKDLVYGLMLRSGNDSAAALAIHHSGSLDKFVGRMNERARELGANDTNFTNPSGLPDPKHYTTAKDLAQIACTAMKNETFAKVVSTKNYNGNYRSFVNKNKILSKLEGANGVKTGYTTKAGRCLVSSCERDGMTVVCVVLDCYDMYERSAKLIDASYEKYGLGTVSKDAVFMADGIACSTDKDYTFVTEKQSELQYEIKCTHIGKRINKGEKVAELEIRNGNNLIFKGNLYSIIEK